MRSFHWAKLNRKTTAVEARFLGACLQALPWYSSEVSNARLTQGADVLHLPLMARVTIILAFWTKEREDMVKLSEATSGQRRCRERRAEAIS